MNILFYWVSFLVSQTIATVLMAISMVYIYDDLSAHTPLAIGTLILITAIGFMPPVCSACIVTVYYQTKTSKGE